MSLLCGFYLHLISLAVISEAYHKAIPADIVDKVKSVLPPGFLEVINAFYQKVVK